jgi:hypothetical protein
VHQAKLHHAVVLETLQVQMHVMGHATPVTDHMKISVKHVSLNLTPDMNMAGAYVKTTDII